MSFCVEFVQQESRRRFTAATATTTAAASVQAAQAVCSIPVPEVLARPLEEFPTCTQCSKVCVDVLVCQLKLVRDETSLV